LKKKHYPWSDLTKKNTLISDFFGYDFCWVSPNLILTIDFNVLIRYRKASTEMEEACLMGFSGGFE